MSQLLAIGLGAVLGAWLRHGLALWLNRITWAGHVPLGTLTANWVGAFLIGGLLGATVLLESLRPEWRLAIQVGFLGALTTFSTWSAEAVAMVLAEAWGALGLHLLLHAGGSIAATLAGMALVARWLK